MVWSGNLVPCLLRELRLKLLVQSDHLCLFLLREHIVLGEIVRLDDGVMAQLMVQWNQLSLAVKHAERVVVATHTMNSAAHHS